LEITVISIVLGVVISAACIGIPQLVRVRSQRPDDNSQAYLKQTGRSSTDVVQKNAALLAQMKSERPGQPS
jgi:hypothetical protein